MITWYAHATPAEPSAARRLDAEDATTGHVLAWAVEHDLDMAARLVTALGLRWTLRGRLAGQESLLRELAGRAEPGSQGWCTAQFWLAWTAFDAADLHQSLQRCAAIVNVIGDREPSRILADCLHLQWVTLSNMGRVPEAARCARRALALARELGYPFAQAYAGDPGDAMQLARRAGQIPGIPCPAARVCGYLLASYLAEAGDPARYEAACAATPTQARDVGDLYALGLVLPVMTDLDVQAGGTGDAAAHLREAAQLSLQTGAWSVALEVLNGCGPCARRPGGPTEAVTVWAAYATLFPYEDWPAQARGAGKNRCVPPARRWGPSRRGRPSSAARR